MRINISRYFIPLLSVLSLSSPSFGEYVHDKDKQFKYVLSSGVFPLHKQAHSVDWQLINTSRRPQDYRVTIYKVSSRDKTVIAPGPLTGTLEPSGMRHNANDVGEKQPFQKGQRYEVIVEVNSREMKPATEMWSGAFGADVIMETVIGAEEFRRVSIE